MLKLVFLVVSTKPLKLVVFDHWTTKTLNFIGFHMWINNSALDAFDRSTWIILDTFNGTTSSDLASSFGATASKFTGEIGANSWLVTDWWIESAFINVPADDTVSSFNFFKTFVTETFKTTPSVLTLRRIFEMMLTLWHYEPIKSWLKGEEVLKVLWTCTCQFITSCSRPFSWGV